MDSKKEEALVAKQYAEKLFAERDFAGAKNFAVKAQMLCSELEGISQMVATYDVYVARQTRSNGEIDLNSILGLKPTAERSLVKKRYKKLAVLLHPDKNRTVGADGAFQIVSEAWTKWSDSYKRAADELKRNGQISSTVVTGPTYANSYDKSAVPPTFWTICTSCQVQYEYLRKYVNKRLSCKNCRATFLAVELGTAPINGSYPVSSQSQLSFAPSDNGYTSHGHGYTTSTYYPTTTSTVYVSGNGVPSYQTGHGSEYVSNGSFQWSSTPGNSTGYTSPNGFTTSPDTIYQTNGYPGKVGRKVKAASGFTVNGSVDGHQTFGTKVTRPYKRRKVEVGASVVNGDAVRASVIREGSQSAVTNQNGFTVPKSSAVNGSSVRHPIPPPIDMRSLLIQKARTVITKKLEEWKLEESQKPQRDLGKLGERRKSDLGLSPFEPKKLAPVNLAVPDSDFHDFDKFRIEECFQPKQIWALYDEEDGMPRLYCLIRQVISTNPFKIHISYLGSKSDTEFGVVNWINSGFTKSCGHFRATNTDIVEQVNMFSHHLTREKAGRGGCVRIYPKSGDIWAVYRNWSPDWNRSTSYDVRHRYEMVEVLEDYCEETGVSVNPLVKLDGFKTVYRRNTDKDAIRWIPRREMVRFSHQVPSWLLKDVDDLPEGCWDLDPAATPEDLLQPKKEPIKDDMQAEEKPIQDEQTEDKQVEGHS